MNRKIIIGLGLVAIAVLGVGLGSAAITGSTTVEDPFNNTLEESVEINVTDPDNQSIRTDATVAGDGNVSIQKIVEIDGEIVKTETDDYEGSSGTVVLSTSYDPEANGTYNVTSKVISGDETLVDSVFFERTNGSSGTVAAGGSLQMSMIELVFIMVLAVGLGAVLLGRE